MYELLGIDPEGTMPNPQDPPVRVIPAIADDFRFHPDPILHFEVPGDGRYTIAVYDNIFRCREDFAYRLAVGELPFITGVFPLGGSI